MKHHSRQKQGSAIRTKPPGAERKRSGFWHAFTLIELLIVVAIIGVLAAIAVPNFLEAQVRSKVARAKADLRSIAAGLETYWMDYKAYPVGRTFCAGSMRYIDDYNMCPLELTTPIAYLSHRPTDVFNPGRQYKYVAPGLGFSNGILTYLPIWIPQAFPDDTGPAEDVAYYSQGESPIDYGLWSVGPSGAKPFWESDLLHLPVPPRTWYDPTNGTAGEGIIARLAGGHQSP